MFFVKMQKMKTSVSLLFSLLLITSLRAQNSVFDLARFGSVKQMEALYQKTPAAINSVDNKKNSPLILACYRGNEAVAFFLIEHVQTINYSSPMGTALMAAVMNGSVSIVEKLIHKKAQLDAVDHEGKSALMYAVFFNKNEIAKQLIEAGANKQLKDHDGKTALDFAQFNANTELIILLNK